METNECPFCERLREAAVEKYMGYCWAFDEFPVTPLHALIFPDGWHAPSFDFTTFGLVGLVIRRVQLRLMNQDPTITGFNIGINDGQSAGQTIPHAHIHVIPRRDGDCEDPRGGVRLMFGEKGRYWE